MSNDRTEFKQYLGQRLMVRLATAAEAKEGYTKEDDVVIVLFDNPSIIIAAVAQDDIYDEFGNYFSFDGAHA